MKLCPFIAVDGPALGAVDGNQVRDLSAVAPELGSEPALALQAGIERLQELAQRAPAHALRDVRLLAPASPRKFLAIGLNYADHIAESGMAAPEVPLFFSKQVTWRS